MSDKDSVKFYPVGEIVTVERESGVRECKVIYHYRDGRLYLEETKTKNRFSADPSKVKKQKKREN